jgi:hypothetical protein
VQDEAASCRELQAPRGANRIPVSVVFRAGIP